MAEVLRNDADEIMPAGGSAEDELAARSVNAEERSVFSGGGRPRVAGGQVFRSCGGPGSVHRRAARVPAGMVPYEVHDFRRTPKLSKAQIRTLHRIHEAFAGLAGEALSECLDTSIQVEMAAAEQVPYNECTEPGQPVFATAINIASIGRQAVLRIDLTMLVPMVDRRLGGTGALTETDRPLSDTERALSGAIIRPISAALTQAWRPVAPLNFEVISSGSAVRNPVIAVCGDPVVRFLFSVRMGGLKGAMSLCVPTIAFDTLRGKLHCASPTIHIAGSHPAQPAERLANSVSGAAVCCAARLGTIPVTVAELAGWRVGQIVPLCGSAVNTGMRDGGSARFDGESRRVEIICGDRTLFGGTVGLVGKRLAVQVEHIVQNQGS